MIGISGECFAEVSINDEQAIRAIIGEDSNSYDGMVAVACGIRNRKSLSGVYGLKAVVWRNGELVRLHSKTRKPIEVISPELWQQASKAWNESYFGPDVVNGASHWEGKHLKQPYWAKSFKNSKVVGANRFYW